ncbi:hypothetical protein FP744_10005448 [Trichoderma asperellum]
MVALAGAGVIGATMYSTRKKESKINDDQNRVIEAHETRELERGSAGGGRDPGYREVSTADSTKNLPAGGVSSGYGGGGSTASVTDKLGRSTSILGGSGKKIASRSDEEGYHDTRGISRMGPEIPSKKRSDVSD